MLKTSRAASLFLGLSCLAACATPSPATPPPPPATAAAPKPNFSLTTPIDRIAANPQGKAVLERDMPGLMASRSYILFDDMSLAQVASLSGGQITAGKLNQVEADLARVDAR